MEKIVCELRSDEGIRFFSDGLCGTLRTIEAGGCKVVIEKKCKVIATLDKPTWLEQHRRVYDSGEISPCLFADYSGGDDKSVKIAECIGGVGEKKSNGGKQFYQQDRIYDGDIALSHPANLPSGSYMYNVKDNNSRGFTEFRENFKVRKLTPRECFRLMGVKDDDFDKIAKNQSNSSLYHLAGDSIIVDVLMQIFKEMI